MKNLYSLFSLCFLISICSSCRKDSSILSNTETDTAAPVEKINASFEGYVVNEEGIPLEGVSIELANQTTYSDQNGYFKLTAITKQYGAYIKAKKEGYFDGLGNVSPSQDGKAFVEFMLLEKANVFELSSQEGGKIQLDKNSVDFKPNSFVDGDNNPYNGKVYIELGYIDPSQENLSKIMPGDLLANREDETQVVLKSYGMMHVELRDETGGVLQLSEAATLSIDVPSSFEVYAPEILPLWFYDEENGIWQEEGTANFDGDMYTGEVHHFTLWNADDPFDLVKIAGRISAVQDLYNERIRITWLDINFSLTTNTDNQGNFSGLVPANESLFLEVLDVCNQVVGSYELGALSEDVTDLDISITNQTLDQVSIIGKLKDCDLGPVTDGYALIQFSNGGLKIAQTDEAGSFQMTAFTCDATNFHISGIDNTTNFQSAVENYLITSNDMVIDNVYACYEPLDFEIELEFTDRTIIFPIDSLAWMKTSGTPEHAQYIFYFKDEQSMTDIVHYDLTLETDQSNGGWTTRWESIETGNPLEHWIMVQSNNVQLEELGNIVEVNSDNGLFNETKTGQQHELVSLKIRAEL